MDDRLKTLVAGARDAIPLLEAYAHSLDDAGRNVESAAVFIAADELQAAVDSYDEQLTD